MSGEELERRKSNHIRFLYYRTCCGIRIDRWTIKSHPFWYLYSNPCFEDWSWLMGGMSRPLGLYTSFCAFGTRVSWCLQSSSHSRNLELVDGWLVTPIWHSCSSPGSRDLSESLLYIPIHPLGIWSLIMFVLQFALWESGVSWCMVDHTHFSVYTPVRTLGT